MSSDRVNNSSSVASGLSTACINNRSRRQSLTERGTKFHAV